MDSVQFALALEHFDVSVHQPHPPGYFLYVMFGRLVNIFIHDPNRTFIFISILFSALAVVVVYYLGKEIFGREAALIAALFAITSPNFWFHGEVALSYAVEGFFSAFIALLCWKILSGKEHHIWLLAIVMALAGGVRQNTPVFLLPLVLFSVRKLPLRKIAAAICLCAGASLLWFIPMTRMTGGYHAYVAAFRALWASTAARKTVFDVGLPALSHNSFILFNFLIYGIGAGVVLLVFCLYYVIRNSELKGLDYKNVMFFGFWILPSFLFFLLIAVHPAVPGHVIIFLPPLLLLTSAAAVYLCKEMKGLFNLDFLGATTIVVILTNLYIFFCLDYNVSYASIRDQDRILSSVIERLKAFKPSTTTLFLPQNYIYCGLSHAIYYLPEYSVYDPHVITHPLSKDRIIWGGLNRNTFLTDGIVMPREKRYFATLFLTDELKKKAVNGMCRIENLAPDIVLISGAIECIHRIYPDMKMRSDNAD